MRFVMNPLTGNLDLVGDSSGSGDVVGPSSATDKAIARYSTTTGKLIQDSPGTVVQDSGAIAAQGFITNRIVIGTTIVGANESWISPALEIQPGGVIQLAAGAQLIIV
jgi:hypothetical protein